MADIQIHELLEENIKLKVGSSHAVETRLKMF